MPATCSAATSRKAAHSVTDAFAGQHVDDAGAFAAGAQHAGSGHRPQVMRGVGHALADLVGDLLDGTFALGEDVDDLGSPATGQRLGHLGERVEQRILRCPISHADLPISSMFKLLLEYGAGKGYIQAVI